MISFTIKNEITCFVDDEDKDLADLPGWHMVKRTGIVRQEKLGRSTYIRYHLRNIIAERKLGRPLTEKEECFNKDKNLANCCRENILIGNRTQLRAHARMMSSNKTGYKGVSWSKKSRLWRADIKIDGKQNV